MKSVNMSMKCFKVAANVNQLSAVRGFDARLPETAADRSVGDENKH